MIRQAIVAIIVIALTAACNTKKEALSSNQSNPQSQNRQQGKPGGQHERPSVEEVFKMDTNNDGKLSKTEVKGPLLDHFSKIDSNNDGFISKTEFENAPKPKRGQNRPPRN